MTRPDGATLAAFGISTVNPESNFVAVRFSNMELDPFRVADAVCVVVTMATAHDVIEQRPSDADVAP